MPPTCGSSLKSVSSGRMKMKALLTESALFPLGSPRWDFPSGRGSRKAVPTRGTGGKVSGTCGISWVSLRKVFAAARCIMSAGRMLEGAISKSLFGLVVRVVVIIYSHINSFGVKKDLTQASAACSDQGAVCYAFVLCLHFNFLH